MANGSDGKRRRKPVAEFMNRLIDDHEELMATTAWRLLSLLRDSWRVTEVGREHRRAAVRRGGGTIYAVFHATALCATKADRDRDRGTAVMLSPHRHGRLTASLIAHYGVQAHFGSEHHRALACFDELVTALGRGDSVIVAVDGSRGPRGEVKPGVALLARRAAAPIVPVGIWASPHVLLRRSWDHHLLALPWARLLAVYGQPIIVTGQGREPVERARTELQRVLPELTARARALVTGPGPVTHRAQPW